MKEVTVMDAEIVPSEERTARAFELIHRVKNAGFETAMALKHLRDENLHEVLRYQSFEDLCQNELHFLNQSQIQKLTFLADTFGQRLHELMQKAGMNLLLETAAEIREKGLDTDSLQPEEYEELIVKLRKEKKKLEKQAEKKDDIIKMKEDDIKRKTAVIQTMEEDYKQKIDALANGKPMPEKNRETKELITELMTTVNQINSELIEIPPEERDAELTNQTAMAIGLLRRVANQLSDEWNNDLHDAEISSPRDPKFTDDLKELED